MRDIMRFIVSHGDTFVKMNDEWKWYENRTTPIMIQSDIRYEEDVNKLFENALTENHYKVKKSNSKSLTVCCVDTTFSFNASINVIIVLHFV